MPHAHAAPDITVLLVDDTPENLSLLGEILMPHYKVRVASNGARALAIAASTPAPDLILLDIMMPDMDGYEVLRRLKEVPATADIPVVFVTALTEMEDEARGFSLGVVDYIAKPVRGAIVMARVKIQLELKHARDILRDQNDWLEREVDRRTLQNRMIQDVTIRALASLAEVRDNETGAHIVRTQNYVRILAEELATLPKYASYLSRRMIDNFAKAAPLHDIGKVGIPDNILHKPGKHTPEEWEIMKTHARLGADSIWRALKDEDDRHGLEFLYVAMEIARHHHEKWDGTGYPEGRRGDTIPLAARLMALADVFDALLTKRVYKPAFSVEATLKIIRDGKGAHFDPDVVEAFERRLQDFLDVAEQHKDPETT